MKELLVYLHKKYCGKILFDKEKIVSEYNLSYLIEENCHRLKFVLENKTKSY
ncbi:MAG: hypothetical protein LBB39_01610 [Mycoplasmataceae bacterium]|jgi:hypothetical protein|nr:hypothetical protein [Mycoplasmataceae bacterium]